MGDRGGGGVDCDGEGRRGEGVRQKKELPYFNERINSPTEVLLRLFLQRLPDPFVFVRRVDGQKARVVPLVEKKRINKDELLAEKRTIKTKMDKGSRNGE